MPRPYVPGPSFKNLLPPPGGIVGAIHPADKAARLASHEIPVRSAHIRGELRPGLLKAGLPLPRCGSAEISGLGTRLPEGARLALMGIVTVPTLGIPCRSGPI
jgi:hypothetical protein